MIKESFNKCLKMVIATGNVALFGFFLFVISCAISESVVPVCSLDYWPIYLSNHLSMSPHPHQLHPHHFAPLSFVGFCVSINNEIHM